MKHALLLVLVFSALCPAAQVELEPTADAFVRYEGWYWYGDYWYGYSDDNFGGELDLILGYVDNDWGHEGYEFEYERSYINFDFASLGGAEVVTAANLGLYCKSIEDPSYSFYVWLAEGDWEEYTITWNNQPGGSDSFSLGWFSIDELVDDAYNEFALDLDKINYLVNHPDMMCGFVILQFSNYCEVVFDSREAANPPYLMIEYSQTAVEQASWGRIKADAR
jgi:hypothetical protein